MTEPIKVPGEVVPEVPAIDLEKYTPKEEVTKLVTEHKQTLEQMGTQLDQAKLSLLDPEYLQYLEDKKGAKPATPAEVKAGAEVAPGVSQDQFLAIQKDLNMTKAAVSDLLAVVELKEVEAKYPDFKEHKEEIRSTIEASSATLNFEQAYLIVKANKGEGAKLPPPPPESEKPGQGSPKEPPAQKDFDSSDEAGEDAWDKTVGKGKDKL